MQSLEAHVQFLDVSRQVEYQNAVNALKHDLVRTQQQQAAHFAQRERGLMQRMENVSHLEHHVCEIAQGAVFHIQQGLMADYTAQIQEYENKLAEDRKAPTD